MEQKIDGPVGGGIRFPFLDALRGLAATWVVVNHVTNYIPILQDRLNVHVYRWVYDLGRFGPTVFFLVSGYVMAHALRTPGAPVTTQPSSSHAGGRDSRRPTTRRSRWRSW